MDPEGLAVAADEVHPLVRLDPAEGAAPRRTSARGRCGRAGRAPRRGRSPGRRTARRGPASATSTSAMPVQPASDSWICSPRYSAASRPTADALIRSGRSLEISVTSWPSLARFGATARIRVSLSPRRKPDGSDAASVWFSSTRMRAAELADRDRLVEATVLHAQLVEHPQRRPGEVAQLGVVPLALELGDHDDRKHHLVLVEPLERTRVGQQDRGVEDVGPTTGGDRRLAVGLAGRDALRRCHLFPL